MFEWMLHNIKGLVREKSNLFFVMIFPVMMVFILGNMLAEMDNPDTAIGTINIAYYAEEAPEVSDSVPLVEHMGRVAESVAVNSFIDALAENEGIEMVKAAGAEAARNEAGSGDIDTAMIFTSPIGIEVSEGDDVYKNRATMLMAQSFARQYAAFKTAAVESPEVFAELASGGIPDFQGLSKDKDLGVSRSMIDYYAVTMIIMIIFMGGGITGASTVFIARQDGSLRRMAASPRSRARLFLDSVLGTTPQNIIQALIVMALSAIFMGANYAGTWQGNILLLCFFVLLGLAVSAVFMLVGLFTRVNPYIPLLAILWALLFISGTFSKEMIIEGFSEYLPMNVAQRAVFDFTVFGRAEQLLGVMGLSAVVLLVACVIGAVLYRRKEIMF